MARLELRDLPEHVPLPPQSVEALDVQHPLTGETVGVVARFTDMQWRFVFCTPDRQSHSFDVEDKRTGLEAIQALYDMGLAIPQRWRG